MNDSSLQPDRETFVERAQVAEPVVVRAAVELDAGVEPLDAYAALTGRTTDADAAEYTFLLESAEKVASSDPDGAFTAGRGADRHARYSFVGYDPAAVVTVEDGEATVAVLDDRYEGLVTTNGGDTLDALRATLPDVPRRNFPETDRQRLGGGLVGFLAYDAVYDLWLDADGRQRPDARVPDAQFVLSTKTLVFDEAARSLSLVFTPVVREADDPDAVYDRLVAERDRVRTLVSDAAAPDTGGFRAVADRAGPREEYEAAVRRAKEHVLDGDVYQEVVSRSRRLYGDVDPLGLYAALRRVNPSPYMYLLGFDDLRVVGASPETLVSVAGDRVTANPIAGTCPRGASPVEDRRLAGELLADDKERAEHTMLVDLARNDVRRVAAPGSVEVEEFMNVLKYSHVQHIESTVSGRLADGPTEAVDRAPDAFDATRAAFPAGTLTGAPKVRAMELIDDTEDEPRGVYGGGVGYYDWTGDADVAIVIRTATVEQGVAPAADGGDDRDRVTGGGDHDRVTVRAGAGVVADSDPESEFAETERKMRGTLDALDRVRVDVDGATAAETAEDPVEGRAESAGGDPA